MRVRPWIWISIDPGDLHTGWAMIQSGDEWATLWTDRAERTTEQLDETVRCEQQLGARVTVVVEEFRLYASKARDQIDSPMLTSQLIGGIKEVCRKYGVLVIEQPASVKKPTAAQLRKRGISLKGDRHAKDAGIHLYHYLMRRGWDGKSPLRPKATTEES